VPPDDPTPELPEPSATGTLAKTPLPHLLVYAHDRELTGTFEFSGPTGQSATVLFIEGQPTKARTTEATVYLGRVLFELGVLTDEQLGILLPRLLGTKELHGQVLTSEGVITDEQLELALRAQLVRQMQSLVHLPPETSYKYYDCFDGLASYGGDGHVGIDPFPLVWACIRDEPSWEHVQVGLARVATAGLKLTESADTSRFSFEKAERVVVELLRQKPWRVHELTASGTLAPRVVQLLVYCLLVTKQVDLVRESKIPDGSAVAAEEEIPEAPPSSPFSGDVMSPPAAAAPRKVARVQLAQRPVTRAPVIVEEDSGAAQFTAETADGRTSYVATQPRSFSRKRPRADSAPALNAVDPSAPVPAASPSNPDAAVPDAIVAPPPAPTEAQAPAKTAPPPAIDALAEASDVRQASSLTSERPPSDATSEVITAPPPPMRDEYYRDDESSDDIFRMPTPSQGIPKVDVSDELEAEPPVRATGEDHTRPTVPKLAAVTPDQIAAHLAESNAKAVSPRAPEVKPAPPPASKPTAAVVAPAVTAIAPRPVVPTAAPSAPKPVAPLAVPSAAKPDATAPATPVTAGPPLKPPPPRPQPPLSPAKPATTPGPTTAVPQVPVAQATPAVRPTPQPLAAQAASAPSPTVSLAPPSSPSRSGVAPSPGPAVTVPPASGPARTKANPISLKEEEEDEEEPPSSRAGAASLRAMQMTVELVARKKEIQDKAANLDKEDYYALLGVTRDTPTSEIQKAFFGLAKKWHPDRVPPVLADVKDLCAKVFSRMSEAHQTLSDTAKRAKYDASKKAGSDDSPEAQAQVTAILDAAMNFQKAEICLKRNDFKQAEELCKKAIDVEPKQADYISMMAWLQAQKPTKQDTTSTQDQVAELTRAIGISQACERAFFYRAMLLKRLGQEGQAMKDFKRAMELNPRNVDATREVRLYNMRGGDKAAPSSKGKEEGGGIFGKLFKK